MRAFETVSTLNAHDLRCIAGLRVKAHGGLSVSATVAPL